MTEGICRSRRKAGGGASGGREVEERAAEGIWSSRQREALRPVPSILHLVSRRRNGGGGWEAEEQAAGSASSSALASASVWCYSIF